MKYTTKDSLIHGKGVFATQYIPQGDIIEIGIDYYYGFFPYVTPYFGSWINHCFNANTRLVYINDKYYVVADKNIRNGTELTINYNQTPWYIMGASPKYKVC
jgi:hypothetical protein